MRVELTVEEAVALATAVRPLPPVATQVRGVDDAVEILLDLRELPGTHGAQRLAVRMAGTATLLTRLTAFADGVATLALDVAVRGLPVDRVVGLLADRLTPLLDSQGLPPGAVVLSHGGQGLTATVQVQRLLEEQVAGLRLTALTLHDGRVHAELEVGQVSLRPPTG